MMFSHLVLMVMVLQYNLDEVLFGNVKFSQLTFSKT